VGGPPDRGAHPSSPVIALVPIPAQYCACPHVRRQSPLPIYTANAIAALRLKQMLLLPDVWQARALAGVPTEKLDVHIADDSILPGDKE